MKAHTKTGQTGTGRPKSGYAAVAAAALLLAGLLQVAPAAAQLGGFRNEPDKPIEVEADALEVEDTNRTATFTGNVRVVQGDIRMKADRITVHYAGKKSGSSRIEKIAAAGNVLISAPDNQTASGDWANYIVATRQIEMGNSVVLRQGENLIRGARLSVNLDSGQARVTGSENGGTGRVKGLFQPRAQSPAE